MGYYSEVGVAMFKEDFVTLFEQCENSKTPKHEDALFCLENCDNYYVDTWQPLKFNKELNKSVPNGPEETIVILHWTYIKAGSTGMQYIFDFIADNGGCLTGVGEDYGDVWYEPYDKEGKENTDWYEYVEPRSYIKIERGIETGNFAQFLKNLDDEA